MKRYTRKEMKEKMEARGLSPNTVKAYVDHIHNLARFTGKPPHTLDAEGILKYQMYLIHERKVSFSYYNQQRSIAEQVSKKPTRRVCAMRFFLTMLGRIPEQVVFNRPGLLKMICLSNISPFRKDTKNYQSF